MSFMPVSKEHQILAQLIGLPVQVKATGEKAIIQAFVIESWRPSSLRDPLSKLRIMIDPQYTINSPTYAIADLEFPTGILQLLARGK